MAFQRTCTIFIINVTPIVALRRKELTVQIETISEARDSCHIKHLVFIGFWFSSSQSYNASSASVRWQQSY
jgi:hypothetical protein